MQTHAIATQISALAMRTNAATSALLASRTAFVVGA